jgi:acyl dehydratase
MTLELDTSELDAHVGVPFIDRALKDPVTIGDFRRWAQAHDNPNPLHFDDDWAARTVFGGIVPAQSFLVATGDGHGAAPARQGNIPGSHLLFGGDEWWFYGPRVQAGDRMSVECMFVDYKVRDTRFAGPAAICRGDSTYVNQRGEYVGKQRSTVIRYLPEVARQRMSSETPPEPEWTDARLAELTAQRMAYIADLRANPERRWADIAVGDRLQPRPLGPHSIAGFAAEYRARPAAVWGASRYVGRRGRHSGDGAGWIPEMNWDLDRAQVDPAAVDGLYEGPSRGHVQVRYAKTIGLPRPYGYGSSMGTYLLDFVGNWAGHRAHVAHSDARYFAPVYAGDAHTIAGEVIDKRERGFYADREVHVRMSMTSQDGERVAAGEMCVAFDA